MNIWKHNTRALWRRKERSDVDMVAICLSPLLHQVSYGNDEFSKCIAFFIPIPPKRPKLQIHLAMTHVRKRMRNICCCICKLENSRVHVREWSLQNDSYICIFFPYYPTNSKNEKNLSTEEKAWGIYTYKCQYEMENSCMRPRKLTLSKRHAIVLMQNWILSSLVRRFWLIFKCMSHKRSRFSTST